MLEPVFQKDHSGKITVISEASRPTGEHYEVRVKDYALKYWEYMY